MLQIRFHGRGGQGVVTAAEMLSVAAFLEGKHAQAFPSFGSERMGAPVMSFCRIDDKDIRTRDPIDEPDALIIQDPTLLQSPGLFSGLSDKGYVLINTAREISKLGIGQIVDKLPKGHLLTVPATELALKHFKKPLPNAAMLGGFVALTGALKIASIAEGIRDAFSGPIGEANVAAAQECYDIVKAARENAGLQNKELVAC
jgi:pyruvate ferredoxin oxidoreductase gamma subunit